MSRDNVLLLDMLIGARHVRCITSPDQLTFSPSSLIHV